jgi:plasmid stabilization system protein ParE
MAVGINWTPEASETFAQNFDYLLQEWSEKEAQKFLAQTNLVVNRLQLFPESYPPGSKNKKYRRARINKYIVLFYAFHKSKKNITLITFWNVKQHPDKLKH